MYITRTMYDQYARYVDLDDRTFFSECIEIAKSNMFKLEEVDIAKIKAATPVCYMSTISSKTASEDIVTRKLLNSSRGRRKFLMIDADFDIGQETDSQRLIDRLKEFSDKMKTPLLIYPTISYPEKPRFRAVLLVKRGLNDSKYWSAMTWLYDQLETKVLDASDLRITANRNLPIFCNSEQVEAIYSTFEDSNLEPLDNSLWKDVKAPAKQELTEEQLSDLKEVTYDEDLLLAGSKKMATRKIAKSYETFWHVVASIAAAVQLEQIDEEVALEMLDDFAQAGSSEHQIRAWEIGNRELYNQFATQYKEIPENIVKARPLNSFSEFAKSAKIKEVK